MRDRVTDYAKKTLADGKMGELHLAACRRHMRDLERQGTETFPFLWDAERAERVLEFAETLTIAEGARPVPLKLMPHQCFDIGSLYGWVHKDTGFRRFRRNYLSVGRQNGKSMMNGVHGTYISGFSGYNHGKLFTASTKRRQSLIAWDEVKKFIQADPELLEMFRVQDWKYTITSKLTGCTIEALSKEGGLDEGFRAIFASIDELQQMKDNSVYSSLYRGTRNLDETLISMITTRGRDFNSFGYEMDTYAVNILNGVVTAEDMFADIYSADKDDDLFGEIALMKANPYLWNTENGKKRLLEDAQTAKDFGGSEIAEYATKTLNIWYADTDRSFINPQEWAECGEDLTLADMQGRECYIGIDLSSGGDLTTVAFDFDLEDEGFEFIETHSFMPRGRLQEHILSDLAPYDVWEQEGLITVTGGAGDFITDHIELWNYLHDVVEEHDLKLLGIAYDRHNIATSLTYMEDFGVDLMDIPQSARSLSDATVDLQLKVRSKKLRHNKNNGLMTWSFANASVTSNSFGEIKVDKKDNKRGRRIDPIDACVNARTMRMVAKKPIDLNEVILSEDWSL